MYRTCVITFILSISKSSDDGSVSMQLDESTVVIFVSPSNDLSKNYKSDSSFLTKESNKIQVLFKMKWCWWHDRPLERRMGWMRSFFLLLALMSTHSSWSWIGIQELRLDNQSHASDSREGDIDSHGEEDNIFLFNSSLCLESWEQTSDMEWRENSNVKQTRRLLPCTTFSKKNACFMCHRNLAFQGIYLLYRRSFQWTHSSSWAPPSDLFRGKKRCGLYLLSAFFSTDLPSLPHPAIHVHVSRIVRRSDIISLHKERKEGKEGKEGNRKITADLSVLSSSLSSFFPPLLMVSLMHVLRKCILILVSLLYI